MISTKTYTEVYEILQVLGKNYTEKIPDKLYKHIDSQRNIRSTFEININKNMDKQEISEETTDFIAYLYLRYWCDEEEKVKLLKQYKENDLKYEKNLRRKYNPDDIFKSKKVVTTGVEEKVSENIAIVKYKESFFKKLIDKIKLIFNTK